MDVYGFVWIYMDLSPTKWGYIGYKEINGIFYDSSVHGVLFCSCNHSVTQITQYFRFSQPGLTFFPKGYSTVDSEVS